MIAVEVTGIFEIRSVDEVVSSIKERKQKSMSLKLWGRAP